MKKSTDTSSEQFFAKFLLKAWASLLLLGLFIPALRDNIYWILGGIIAYHYHSVLLANFRKYTQNLSRPTGYVVRDYSRELSFPATFCRR